MVDKKQVMISVIIPVYNSEKYLRKCIDSVLAQSYTNFELILVNDGSTDKSAAICDEFAEKDERVKVFHNKNMGVSSSRNFALDRATGSYIYFTDSDDWIEAELLNDCIEILENEKLDIITFGYMINTKNDFDEVVNSIKKTPGNKTYIKGKDKISVNNGLLTLLGYACNKVYRKSLIDKLNLRFNEDISLFEDFIFNAEIYMNISTLKLIDKPYYHYMKRANESLSSTFHKDFYSLQLLRISYVDLLLINWEVDNKVINNFKINSLISSIVSISYKLFSNKIEFSFNEKSKYIKEMLLNNETKQMVNLFRPNSFRGLIIKILIKCKMNNTIAILMLFKTKYNTTKIFVQNKVNQ